MSIRIDPEVQISYYEKFHLHRGKAMNARAMGLLLACFYLGTSGLLPGLAWGQSDSTRPPAAAIDANPIGKVLNATGSVTVEHASAILVQANLPTGSAGQAKVDDPVYRGDLIQTGADGALGISIRRWNVIQGFQQCSHGIE